MKVLVIEDNQQVVGDISFCLQVRYPEVLIVSVAEGSKGIEMVETESPDLVMVDSSLADIDTLDLVTKIREFSDVPLVIISEVETDIDIAKGLEAGAVMSEERKVLTDRESQILRLVADGYVGKTIASELNISEQTVKNHLWVIRKILKAKKTPHAIAIALREGLIK